MTVAIPTLKRSKSGSGLLAALLALAVAGLIAAIAVVAAVGTDGSGGSDASIKPAPGVERSHASLVLYLVGSQEQADLVQRSLDEAAIERVSNGIPEPNAVFTVLKVTTPEDDLTVDEILTSWYAGEPDSVYVHDLRE